MNRYITTRREEVREFLKAVGELVGCIIIVGMLYVGTCIVFAF